MTILHKKLDFNHNIQITNNSGNLTVEMDSR